MKCPVCRARLALVELPSDPGGAPVEEVRLARTDSRVEPEDAPTARSISRARRSSDHALISQLGELRRQIDALQDQEMRKDDIE